MSDDSQRPIIVKRIKKGAHGHHGGAWKIAYADFVTAMMAFFLLMWLLGSTTSGDMKGIAQFFQSPLKVALSGGTGAGDATSLIKGGGEDLSRSTGQLRRGDLPPDSTAVTAANSRVDERRREMRMLQQLKGKVERSVAANPAFQAFKNQIALDMTPEGLRIQIVDEQNRPMFNSGSANLESYARDILRELGRALNEVPNKLSLSGHTDATLYASGDRGYSNWELSADRANASRREMIVGGMSEAKILRVVGLGSAAPLDTSNPVAPINRRISIIVLNREAEELIMRSNSRSNPVVEDEGVAPSGSAPSVAAPVAASATGPSGTPGIIQPIVVPTPTSANPASTSPAGK